MTTVDQTVPIPACLAHRPVQDGLVVPVTALRRGDRWLTSINDIPVTWAVIVEGRCGICGEPLGPRPAVALTGRPDLNHVTDPANHPECVGYAVKACPMLSGRMSRYLDRGLVDHPPGPCDRPGCECNGTAVIWGPRHAGEPAPLWWAVWIRRYRVALNPDHSPYGLVWDVKDVIRMHPVR